MDGKADGPPVHCGAYVQPPWLHFDAAIPVAIDGRFDGDARCALHIEGEEIVVGGSVRYIGSMTIHGSGEVLRLQTSGDMGEPDSCGCRLGERKQRRKAEDEGREADAVAPCVAELLCVF